MSAVSSLDEKAYELKCQTDYGISDKIFDTWTKTYLLLSTFNMINFNLKWLNRPLHGCWQRFLKSPDKAGDLIVKLTERDDINYIDAYDHMLSSGQGQNYFIEKKIPGKIIDHINAVMKKEILTMYFASLYINDEYERESILNKANKHKPLTPKQMGSIAYLHKLYMKTSHPIVAILIFNQLDMEHFFLIGF